MTPERKRWIKVIAFLVATAALFVVTVFYLGRSQNLFSRKVALKASFADINGLTVGAPVRLAGLDIGIVQRIDFDRELSVKQIHILMGIESRYLPRVRADSIAKLASKGLLGDTIINITVGSVDAAPLAAGAELQTAESAGTAEVIDEVKDAVASLRALISPEVTRDVGRIAHATAGVMEDAQRGRGLVHALLTDPSFPAELHRVLRGADRLVTNVDGAAVRAKQLLAAVQEKRGLLHALVYAPEGAATITDLRRASADLAALVAELRTGDGLAHKLIYDRDQGELITNLTALSQTLRRIGDGVERGEGTVGALLRDPTIYEDLKLILGRVERNRLLKTLVRYTIKADSLSRGSTGQGAKP